MAKNHKHTASGSPRLLREARRPFYFCAYIQCSEYRPGSSPGPPGRTVTWSNSTAMDGARRDLSGGTWFDSIGRRVSERRADKGLPGLATSARRKCGLFSVLLPAPRSAAQARPAGTLTARISVVRAPIGMKQALVHAARRYLSGGTRIEQIALRVGEWRAFTFLPGLASSARRTHREISVLLPASRRAARARPAGTLTARISAVRAPIGANEVPLERSRRDASIAVEFAGPTRGAEPRHGRLVPPGRARARDRRTDPYLVKLDGYGRGSSRPFQRYPDRADRTAG